MRMFYKKAIGVFTALFVLGVAIMAVANFMRGMAIHGTLQIVGAVSIVAALAVYMVFWRCPVCRELLPRPRNVSPRCKNCSAQLFDEEDKVQ